jgi:hypothetical protein
VGKGRARAHDVCQLGLVPTPLLPVYSLNKLRKRHHILIHSLLMHCV